MKKYISLVPLQIRFKDEDGKDIEGKDGLMTWKRFLHKVEDNPKWVTAYRLGRYMTEIWEAFHAAEERGDQVMELSDDAYKEFEEACQTPKYQIIHPIHGAQDMAGWRVHARLNCQMIVFPMAVINAVDEDPRKKEEEPEKEKAPKKEKAA